MSETPENAIPKNLASNVSDDYVEARFDVAVMPGENASIHYTVWPRDEANAVTSVTASFVLEENSVVVHDYAGATTVALVAPKAGQGSTGDIGVDVSVFAGERGGELMAILSGTVRVGEETRNYFFKRPLDLTPVEPPADDA